MAVNSWRDARWRERTLTVNKERVALWVEALRDPRLVQGTGQLAFKPTILTTDDVANPEAWQQCCLDVACQVALANGLRVEETVETTPTGSTRVYNWVREINEDHGVRVTDHAEKNLLPDPVRAWFGLSDVDPVVALKKDDDGIHVGEVTASCANDELRWSFTQIADSIVRIYLEGDGDADGDLQAAV